MTTTTRHTTIVESADGQRWTWMEQDRRFRSLTAAMRADDRDAKVHAARHGKVITVREIKPNTPTGALIARALTRN